MKRPSILKSCPVFRLGLRSVIDTLYGQGYSQPVNCRENSETNQSSDQRLCSRGALPEVDRSHPSGSFFSDLICAGRLAANTPPHHSPRNRIRVAKDSSSRAVVDTRAGATVSLCTTRLESAAR